MSETPVILSMIDNADVTVTKDMLVTRAAELVEEIVEEGFTDIMEMDAKMFQVVFFLNEMRQNLKSHVINELEMENDNKKQIGNIMLGVTNTGKRLDYEKDPVYKKMKAELKARENELKQAHNGLDIVDQETGELMIKVPVKTPSKTTTLTVFK